MEQVVSPLTGSPRVSLLRRVTAADVAARWQREFGMDVAAELGGAAEIRLYRCDDTGLRFYWPPSAAGSDKLYEQLQRYDWYYMPDKWEYGAAIEDLRGCASVLEVGSGAGAFVGRARAAGIDVRGIEINTEAVKAAAAAGLPVEARDLAELARERPESVDAACSFQVLEHVPDVGAFIGDCARLVRTGGTLVFAVPNGDLLADLDTVLDAPPHHMSQWTSDAFAALSRVFPIDLVRVRREPLAARHVGMYAAARWATLRRRHPRLAWLFTRYTRIGAQLALGAGLRRLAQGHTLYAAFRKR